MEGSRDGHEDAARAPSAAKWLGDGGPRGGADARRRGSLVFALRDRTAEQPVRDQLEQVLPRGVAVGKGFVIDSYGGTSRQQDVVLYERDFCPVFSINDTRQTTFYPCEGVIAVGEIKSRLDRDSLENAFKKVASVKALRRHAVAHFMPHPKTGAPIPRKRKYLSCDSRAARLALGHLSSPLHTHFWVLVYLTQQTHRYVLAAQQYTGPYVAHVWRHNHTLASPIGS